MNRRTFIKGALTAGVFGRTASPVIKGAVQIVEKQASRLPNLMGHIDTGKVNISRNILKYAAQVR